MLGLVIFNLFLTLVAIFLLADCNKLIREIFRKTDKTESPKNG